MAAILFTNQYDAYELNQSNPPDGPQLGFGAAAPTTGFWRKGDTIMNIVPAVAAPSGWKCTVAGIPGTWVSFGAIA